MCNRYYECQVCHGHNAITKLCCSFCGAVQPLLSDGLSGIIKSPVAAQGCYRQEMSHQTKANLRTVPLDYYADGE